MYHCTKFQCDEKNLAHHTLYSHKMKISVNLSPAKQELFITVHLIPKLPQILRKYLKG